MRLSIYLSYISKKSVVLLATFITILSGFFALTASQAQTSDTLVWSDEFNDISINTNKWTAVEQKRSIESHHQGRYQARNVSVSDGNLRIVTERHCVVGDELPSPANASTEPCPSGTSTKYSSGQVRTPYLWKEGKMEIRAKMPKTTQSGLWSGFWLRQEGQWCTPQYGEIDILEWYSDPESTDASTATTHISCANNDLESRQHVERVNGSLADTWHTWGVEWDTTGVTYFLDGKVVGSITSHRPNDDNQDKDTYTDYDGMSKEFFESVMDRPWHLRINTQVYPSDDQWHKAPDNNAPFTPQTMLVDYVRIYRTGSDIPDSTTSPIVEESDTEEVAEEVTPDTTTPAEPATPAEESDDSTESPVIDTDTEEVTEQEEEPAVTPPAETDDKEPVTKPQTKPTSETTTDERTEDTTPSTPATATPTPTSPQADVTGTTSPVEAATDDTPDSEQAAIDPATPTSLPKTGSVAESPFLLVPPLLILFTSYGYLRSYLRQL